MSQQSNVVTFNKKKLKALKKAYQQCVDRKEDVFVFEGQELVVGYAKYLIEYLDSISLPS